MRDVPGYVLRESFTSSDPKNIRGYHPLPSTQPYHPRLVQNPSVKQHIRSKSNQPLAANLPGWFSSPQRVENLATSVCSRNSSNASVAQVVSAQRHLRQRAFGDREIARPPGSQPSSRVKSLCRTVRKEMQLFVRACAPY